MKILRFDEGRYGVLEGPWVFVTEGPGGKPTGERLALASVRLRAPATPTKVVGVGKNYAAHAREMGSSPPAEPGLFLIAPNAVIGPGEPIPYPGWTKELHYEGELAVVVGKTMRNVPASEALAYVLGYTVANDVTARDKQRTDLQWVRAKSADGFLPLGPWIETGLEPQNTWVRTYVNGELKQEGHTGEMIFSVAEVLAYISAFMTLLPGDVVITGTPEGVGPIHVGDVVEVAVEGIGTLKNPVEAAP